MMNVKKYKDQIKWLRDVRSAGFTLGQYGADDRDENPEHIEQLVAYENGRTVGQFNIFFGHGILAPSVAAYRKYKYSFTVLEA